MDYLTAGMKILSGLVQAFQYQPVVIAYIRRQDHLLGAHYVEYVKGSNDPTIEFKTFACFCSQTGYAPSTDLLDGRIRH